MSHHVFHKVKTIKNQKQQSKICVYPSPPCVVLVLKSGCPLINESAQMLQTYSYSLRIHCAAFLWQKEPSADARCLEFLVLKKKLLFTERTSPSGVYPSVVLSADSPFSLQTIHIFKAHQILPGITMGLMQSCSCISNKEECSVSCSDGSHLY